MREMGGVGEDARGGGGECEGWGRRMGGVGGGWEGWGRRMGGVGGGCEGDSRATETACPTHQSSQYGWYDIIKNLISCIGSVQHTDRQTYAHTHKEARCVAHRDWCVGWQRSLQLLPSLRVQGQ